MVSLVSPQRSAPWGNGGDMDGVVQERDEASGPNRAALGMGRGGCGDTVMAERPQSLQGQHKLGPQIGTTSPDASRNTQPEQGPAAPKQPTPRLATHRLLGGRNLQPRRMGTGDTIWDLGHVVTRFLLSHSSDTAQACTRTCR